VLALSTDEENAAVRIALLEEAVALSRAASATSYMATHLAFLAAAVAEVGDLQRARALLEEGDVLARAANNPWSRQMIDNQLGWLAIAEGRLDDADTSFRALLNPSARRGSEPIPVGLVALGQVSLLRGDVEQARALHRRALIQIQEAEHDGTMLADALVDMACVEAVAGRHERAQRLLGANETWYAAHGGAGRLWRPSTRNPQKRGLVPIPPMPTDPLLMRARVEGRGMSLDQAVALALKPVDPSSLGPDHADTAHVGTAAGR
jgi:tetratricopeptide (TPR) repeat protein